MIRALSGFRASHGFPGELQPQERHQPSRDNFSMNIFSSSKVFRHQPAFTGTLIGPGGAEVVWTG